jgi:hypothetical protein
MNIEDILGYYAFNNREFPQEFEDYLEELPFETYEQVQRQLTRIRVLRRNLQVFRRQHSEVQIGSEQYEQIREALRLTNVDIHNIIDAILVDIRAEPVEERGSIDIVEHAEEIQRYREVLVLNNQPIITEEHISNDQNALQQLSYETLLKQLYGLPIILPQFLIVNGVKVNFIPFSQINSIQIDRYLIEPLLQPWAEPPNRILTIFGKNGMTYLVKAKYDAVSNQIFPPV